MKRILSLAQRYGRTTETVRHFYQNSRKTQVGTEDQDDHFFHTDVQTSNTQGLLLRSRVLLQTPHTATQDGEVVIVELGPFPTSSTHNTSGCHIPAEDQRSIQLTSSNPCLDAPLAIFHRSFPSHKWAGRGCEEDHASRYPLTALPRDQQMLNWLWLPKTQPG